MGRVRMTRTALARAGVAVGGGLFTVGVGLAIDLAAALMTAGLGLGAYCLLLMDVAPPKKSRGDGPW
ncbi:hypothetical protein SUDANB145_07115 (plasmid) [Streptomyces sp. enrichment culture]|uniref:hypothetical protein n=1 Tax=Streptomyces sp. enrichment culture TaxID=1795815 RepID=UPI003F56571F